MEKGEEANGFSSVLHFFVFVLHFIFTKTFFQKSLGFELAKTGREYISASYKLE